MNLKIFLNMIAITVGLSGVFGSSTQAQSLQTVNIATAAAGQSGYVAALIDAKGNCRQAWP